MTLLYYLVFTIQPYGGYHRVSGPLAQLSIGQDPVDQAFSLLEKNVTLGSQQDNAQPDTARLSINFLHANDVNTLPWSSRSPDLAPIEHIWDMLNRQIRENHHPFNSLQELENALIIEWNAIQQYKIQNLIRGCRDTITANGTWTRY